MAAKGTRPRSLGAPLDDESLEEGFRDHRDTVFRFLLRRTRHAERAEDLAQHECVCISQSALVLSALCLFSTVSFLRRAHPER